MKRYKSIVGATEVFVADLLPPTIDAPAYPVTITRDFEHAEQLGELAAAYLNFRDSVEYLNI